MTNSGDIEQGWHDIPDAHHRITHLALTLKTGVMDKSRHSDTPLAGETLEQTKRPAASARPVGPIPNIGIRLAHIEVTVVTAFDHPLLQSRPTVFQVVAFRAVIREKNNQGIVQLIDAVEVVQQAPCVNINIINHRRINFHFARFGFLLLTGQIIPGFFAG